MKVIKCENNHFYDADKYGSCPHCAAQKVNTPTEKNSPQGQGMENMGKGIKCPSCGNELSEEDKFCGKCGAKIGGRGLTAASVPIQHPGGQPIVQVQHPNGMPAQVQRPSVNPIQVQQGIRMQSASNSPKVAASESDEKTVALFGGNTQKQYGIVPVAGWLVCIKGKHIGENFKIVIGQNTVGRGINNRIVLSKDAALLEEGHLVIVYEPRGRVFFVQPGNVKSVSYLNGEIITGGRRLKAKDRLDIGGGSYMFIPLCGTDFSWENFSER